MKDDLLKVYEQMYGSKNTVEQVEEAIQTNLRGSGDNGLSVIQEYKQVNGYPKNEPAKPVSAKDHVPEEIKPAIEAPEELSPAVNSSTSKEKLTKTITDKEKKNMASHKFSFDELYKTALSEQMEMGAEDMDMGDEEAGPETDLEVGAESEAGGEEITVTISREAATALCDVLQAALEGGEGEEEMGEEELGGEEEGGEEEGGEEEGEDLEEATKMDKAPAAKSGAHAKGTQKVVDPTTLNKGREFAKANINPHAHVKVHKPKELKYKTTGPQQ